MPIPSPSLTQRWKRLILAAILGPLAACGAAPPPGAPSAGAPPPASATTAAATAPPPAATAGAPEPSSTPTLTAEDTALVQRFRAAVTDAEEAELAEISGQLTAITEDNAELVRQPGTGRVLVATWTSWNGYDTQVGAEMPLTRETWVTVVPELQEFCHAYQPGEVPLTLRLEQLLGLPPKNGKTRVVQLWAPADGLFRPSPDPEITDNVAQLDMPNASAFPSYQDYLFSRDWFNLQRSLSYDEKNGYPWTRLGYTYDWGDPDSEIGLSEFVIWAGTTVGVESVAQTDAYCTQ